VLIRYVTHVAFQCYKNEFVKNAKGTMQYYSSITGTRMWGHRRQQQAKGNHKEGKMYKLENVGGGGH
jgi:hypothetical protein